MGKISPRVLQGFKDSLPREALLKENMLRIIVDAFRQFGFFPIYTPHLELSDILLSRAGVEMSKQVYRFQDNGGRDVALRYDQTVPLARFVSQHFDKLSFPFKRYAIGEVFRGEKPQRGRYREFTQCDFDIIGSNELDADLEIIIVICHVLKMLFLDKEVLIRINNRKVLDGLCEELGILDDKKLIVFKIIDKLDKQGCDSVKKELAKDVLLSKDQIDTLMIFIEGDFSTNLDRYQTYTNTRFKDGMSELDRLYQRLVESGLESMVSIDFSIVRGLSYYTGVVYETILTGLPEIGAICSGGRYDNLIKNFSNRALSGTGASIGLDRLMAALSALNMDKRCLPDYSVLIATVDGKHFVYRHHLAMQLRNYGVSVSMYLDYTKKIGVQFNYAEKNNFSHVIVIGDQEVETNSYSLKNILTGEKKCFDNVQDLLKIFIE